MNATRSDPIDIQSACPHCGQKIRSHCKEHDCTLCFRWCAEALRATFPEIFKAAADDAGNCKKCGEPLARHFTFPDLGIEIGGRPVKLRGEVTYPYPDFQECRDAAPDGD